MHSPLLTWGHTLSTFGQSACQVCTYPAQPFALHAPCGRTFNAQHCHGLSCAHAANHLRLACAACIVVPVYLAVDHCCHPGIISPAACCRWRKSDPQLSRHHHSSGKLCTSRLRRLGAGLCQMRLECHRYCSQPVVRPCRGACSSSLELMLNLRPHAWCICTLC